MAQALFDDLELTIEISRILSNNISLVIKLTNIQDEDIIIDEWLQLDHGRLDINITSPSNNTLFIEYGMSDRAVNMITLKSNEFLYLEEDLTEWDALYYVNGSDDKRTYWDWETKGEYTVRAIYGGVPPKIYSNILHFQRT